MNDEINRYNMFLNFCFDMLNPGGRLVVISFNSLEDRPTKLAFRKWAKSSLETHTNRKKSVARILTKKPIIATESENQFNIRARSAKVRAIEKL